MLKSFQTLMLRVFAAAREGVARHPFAKRWLVRGAKDIARRPTASTAMKMY